MSDEFDKIEVWITYILVKMRAQVRKNFGNGLICLTKLKYTAQICKKFSGRAGGLESQKAKHILLERGGIDSGTSEVNGYGVSSTRR